MRRHAATTLVIASVLLAAFGSAPPPASASDPDEIFMDCASSTTGLLERTYDRGDLRHALDTMPADIAEYTGCRNAIMAAMRRQPESRAQADDAAGDTEGPSPGEGAGGGDGGGGIPAVSVANGTDAGSAPANPQAGSDAPVRLSAATVVPGFKPRTSSRSLPAPMLALLALLVVGAGAMASSSARSSASVGWREVSRRR